jgi:hypothetical protein
MLLIIDPLDLAGDGGPLLLNLVLLLLVTSSGVEPFPLTLVPRWRSPSSAAAHRLGLAIESHDPDALHFLDGVARWVN